VRAHIKIPVALPAMLLACSQLAVPAQAAPRDRVFVASYGTDTGNTVCSFTQPCRTFQNAVNNVAVGGEVTAIDSAGFQPVNITQSVTITSPPGVEAGIAASPGLDAIDISGSGITVVLRGLTLLGSGTGAEGINFTAGSRIEIIDCAISGFTTAGIDVSTPDNTSVLISNSVVVDLGPASNGLGIGLSTATSGVSLTAALDHVTVSNAAQGLRVSAAPSNGPIEVLITDSHLDNNTSFGIDALGGGSTSNAVNIVLKNVTLNQDPTGIVLGSFANVWLSQVTQTSMPGFAATSINFSGVSNSAVSDGTNHLMGALGGGGTLGTWTSN
jgi:hypothetical protein